MTTPQHQSVRKQSDASNIDHCGRGRKNRKLRSNLIITVASLAGLVWLLSHIASTHHHLLPQLTSSSSSANSGLTNRMAATQQLPSILSLRRQNGFDGTNLKDEVEYLAGPAGLSKFRHTKTGAETLCTSNFLRRNESRLPKWREAWWATDPSLFFSKVYAPPLEYLDLSWFGFLSTKSSKTNLPVDQVDDDDGMKEGLNLSPLSGRYRSADELSKYERIIPPLILQPIPLDTSSSTLENSSGSSSSSTSVVVEGVWDSMASFPSLNPVTRIEERTEQPQEKLKDEKSGSSVGKRVEISISKVDFGRDLGTQRLVVDEAVKSELDVDAGENGPKMPLESFTILHYSYPKMASLLKDRLSRQHAMIFTKLVLFGQEVQSQFFQWCMLYVSGGFWIEPRVNAAVPFSTIGYAGPKPPLRMIAVVDTRSGGDGHGSSTNSGSSKRKKIRTDFIGLSAGHPLSLCMVRRAVKMVQKNDKGSDPTDITGSSGVAACYHEVQHLLEKEEVLLLDWFPVGGGDERNAHQTNAPSSFPGVSDAIVTGGGSIRHSASSIQPLLWTSFEEYSADGGGRRSGAEAGLELLHRASFLPSVTSGFDVDRPEVRWSLGGPYLWPIHQCPLGSLMPSKINSVKSWEHEAGKSFREQIPSQDYVTRLMPAQVPAAPTCSRSMAKSPIPKLLVQTNKAFRVPDGLYRSMRLNILHNPDFEYRYYTDRTMREFLVEEFSGREAIARRMKQIHQSTTQVAQGWSWPDRVPTMSDLHPTTGDAWLFFVLDAFDLIIPGAYKSDLWRYAFLFVNGGVYLDGDMQLRQPLREILGERPSGTSMTCGALNNGSQPNYYSGGKCVSQMILPTFIAAEDNGRRRLYQAFMAATPNHPLLENALRLTVYRIMMRSYGDHGSLWLTGPFLMKEVFTKWMRQWDISSRLSRLSPGIYQYVEHDPNNIQLHVKKAVEILQYRKDDLCAIGYVTRRGKDRYNFSTTVSSEIDPATGKITSGTKTGGGGAVTGKGYQEMDSNVAILGQYSTYAAEMKTYFRNKVYYHHMWRRKEVFRSDSKDWIKFLDWGLLGGPVRYVFPKTDEEDAAETETGFFP